MPASPIFSDPNAMRPDQVMAYLMKLSQDVPATDNRRAVIYVSKSRVLKNSKHYSLGIQEQECRGLAERMELDVIEVVEYLDKSGKKSNRPGLQKILRMIKSQQVEFVLSQFIDRNYRNGLSLLKFY